MITFQTMNRAPRELTPAMLRSLETECGRALSVRRKTKRLVGLRFVTPREIQRLNRVYRGKDCPTDVLSFASEEGAEFPEGDKRGSLYELGDLILCPVVARREAKRRSIESREEFVRLIAHGVLHLAGFDHATPKQEEKMFAIQEKIVEKIV